MYLLLLLSLFTILSTQCASSATGSIVSLSDTIDRPAACPFCHFTCKRNSELNVHFISKHRHADQLAHKLPIQFQIKFEKRELITPNKSNADRKLKCDYAGCKATFEKQCYLSDHALKHIKAVFMCECGREISPLHEFIRHVQDEHHVPDESNQPITTQAINPPQQTPELATAYALLPTETSLPASSTLPILSAVYVCDFPHCKEEYGSLEELNEHQRTTFSHGYWWTCFNCSQQFATSHELACHIQLHYVTNE